MREGTVRARNTPAVPQYYCVVLLESCLTMGGLAAGLCVSEGKLRSDGVWVARVSRIVGVLRLLRAWKSVLRYGI